MLQQINKNIKKITKDSPKETKRNYDDFNVLSK